MEMPRETHIDDDDDVIPILFPVVVGKPTKRGPGRPSRRPAIPVLDRKGVVEAPDFECSLLELVYDAPQAFKALFTYMKSLKAKVVIMRFDENGITLYARDHTEKSVTIAHINGHKMNWYYCAERFAIELNRENVDKMFMNVDKTFHKISMFIETDEREFLRFAFKDADIDKECNYKIGVNICEFINDHFLAAEEIVKTQFNFPIEFTLTVKQFEKTISDSVGQSDDINIVKSGDLPLEIKYNKGAVTYKEVYRDGTKIDLTCRLDTIVHFSTKVKLINIKPLVGSMVTDKVRICCGEDGRLMFRLVIKEEAVIVNAITAGGG